MSASIRQTCVESGSVVNPSFSTGFFSFPVGLVFGISAGLFLSPNVFAEPKWVIELEQYEYKEPGVMRKTASPGFIGIGVETYRSQAEPGLFYAVRGHVGQTDYRSVTTGAINGDPSYRLQLEGGFSYPVNSSINVFSGLGFRWLLDDAGGRLSTTGHASYDRESRYLYLPVGIQIPLNGGYLRAKYQYFVQGQQVSYMTNVSGGLSNLSNRQDDGFGYELTYQSDSGWGAYTRYWSVSDSNIDRYLTTNGYVSAFEPRNETVELGIRLNFQFE
jgi:hypothetical protein